MHRRAIGSLITVLLVLAACRTQSDVEYWEERARKHGARSVLNLGHGEHEIDEVTRRQIEIHSMYTFDIEAVRREIKEGLEKRILAVTR